MKLCKDQLTDKLVEIFESTDPEYIDEAVNKAKKQVEEKGKKAKQEDLVRLFDGQIQTLKNRGCPKAILEMLTEQKSVVLEKASQMTFVEGRIPFLPVIPKTYLTIYSQMATVVHDGKSGYTYLDPNEISDVVETPKTPYYIFDVEDGAEMLGKSPKNAEKIIKKQGRRGLTDIEVISLGIHSDVLKRHYVDACGSRYASGQVPFLYLGGGVPELRWNFAESGDGYWGSASCGS